MAIVDREFRYNSIANFWADMVAAGMVVPDPEPTDLGTYVAVDDPGPPGLFYRADYRLFNLQTAVDDLDPPTMEDRGLHINMRVTGARANAISAQLDNFYRQANPAVDVETPANVITFYDLAVEGTENPGQKVIRKGTAKTNGTMFDIKGSGQPENQNSEFYSRKRTFGAK
jgi:hypothetical protein